MASTVPQEEVSLADTSNSTSGSGSGTIPSPKKGPHKAKSLNLRKRGTKKRMSIHDMTDEEKAKAIQFDLDGDGELDEAELAMMRYDVDGDGNLTSAEIHA